MVVPLTRVGGNAAKISGEVRRIQSAGGGIFVFQGLDAAWSEGTEFGERLVNSMFTLGLVVGLSVGDTTLGTTVGNLGWEEVRFPKPVFAGDTITYSVTLTGSRELASRSDRLINTILNAGRNQKGEPVIRFESTVLEFV